MVRRRAGEHDRRERRDAAVAPAPGAAFFTARQPAAFALDFNDG